MCTIYDRNPTPESSLLPKWDKAEQIPVNYYRIGNFHFDEQPLFGMETGGLFEDRAEFWREIQSSLTNETLESLTGSGSYHFNDITIFSYLFVHLLFAFFH